MPRHPEASRQGHTAAPSRDERSASPAGEALFERLPLPAWVFDAATLRFLQVNAAAVNSYGWSREQFLGMTIEDIRPPETIPMLQQALAEAASRSQHSAVTVHRTRDGSTRTVEVSTQEVTFEGRPARLAVVQDLDEWMAMQRAARATEESYRALVDQLSEVFFRSDLQGRWTLLTPSWELLTGHRPDESLGHPFLDFIDARDHRRAREALAQLVAGTVSEVSLPLRYRRDDSFRWVEARARLVREPATGAVAIAGTLHDVTQRIEAQEQARSSDARFRAIFDRAAIGIVVATLDGHILEANDAYQAFVGYSEEELRRMEPGSFTPPEERALEREMLQLVAMREPRVAFEKRYVRRDGRVAWGKLTLSSVVDHEGVPQRVIAMVEDVTARRAAEMSLTAEREFLRTLLDNMSDGIIACDALGIVTVSNAVVRELGLVENSSVGSDASRLSGRVYGVDGLEPMSSEEMPLARALRGEVVRGEELVVVPRGGAARTMLASALAFRNERGEQLGAVLALHDITDRKAAEVALRWARDEAEEARERAEVARASADEASRSKSDFLARMSHELRTPLNSIIGFANVLLRNRPVSLSDADLRYLERISANGRHLLAIINDLLDLTRVEAGRMPVVPEPVAVGELVAECVAAFEPQVRERDVVLVAEVPPASRHLQADPARLRQVLLNLVGNSVKFTEHGEVRVRLVTGPDGAPLRIEVTDTGIGIEPGRLRAIFDAFEQAEPTTTRRFGGTGLGLAISRSLCELMGFTLEARSTPGVGTTMIVDLAPEPAAPHRVQP